MIPNKDHTRPSYKLLDAQPVIKRKVGDQSSSPKWEHLDSPLSSYINVYQNCIQWVSNHYHVDILEDHSMTMLSPNTSAKVHSRSHALFLMQIDAHPPLVAFCAQPDQPIYIIVEWYHQDLHGTNMVV